MKDSIVAYVTALVNSHERDINRLKEINVNSTDIRKHENIKDELTDLLDFIEDIPEDKAISEEAEELESTINRLKGNICKDANYQEVLKAKIAVLEKQLKEKSDLEQYADFIKAIRAYHEANRTIVCKYGNVYSHTHTYKATGNGLLDENDKGIISAEILEGKWSIEGEEE